MEHSKVLKRAWEILWRYKALWVFGILVALGVADVGGRSTSSWRFGSEDFSPGGQFHISEIPPGAVETLIAVGIGLACVAAFLIIATVIARYVGEVALIRMVDDYEETGETRSVRQGFRIGWSRSAWRLFLINLTIDAPTVLAFLLVFALTFAPLLLWITDSNAAGVLGTVLTIGLFFVAILLVIVVAVALSVLKYFFRRVCVLEKQGVIESIRQGYAMVRRHLKDVGLMWLIMTGVNLGWALLMVPIALLLLALGAAIGGGLGFAVYSLAESAGGATPWVLAILVGLPVFLLLLGGPLAFLGGLMETFRSSTWTLTYRELRALEGLEPQPPELGVLDLEEHLPDDEPTAA
jgi:hypothetical protein